MENSQKVAFFGSVFEDSNSVFPTIFKPDSIDKTQKSTVDMKSFEK